LGFCPFHLPKCHISNSHGHILFYLYCNYSYCTTTIHTFYEDLHHQNLWKTFQDTICSNGFYSIENFSRYILHCQKSHKTTYFYLKHNKHVDYCYHLHRSFIASPLSSTYPQMTQFQYPLIVLGIVYHYEP
jgi:hypothetical protein